MANNIQLFLRYQIRYDDDDDDNDDDDADDDSITALYHPLRLFSAQCTTQHHYSFAYHPLPTITGTFRTRDQLSPPLIMMLG
ncbi:hypothetical protein [Absidia glauca]|uniref:Uncharacterized protein n=1 Tax=Absidia glauca TaxID=4829 RepID=A0A163KP51_ABSGL|nr:hypothetical protein [Absidia glauca]